jgi:hypothetical protein
VEKTTIMEAVRKGKDHGAQKEYNLNPKNEDPDHHELANSD